MIRIFILITFLVSIAMAEEPPLETPVLPMFPVVAQPQPQQGAPMPAQSLPPPEAPKVSFKDIQANTSLRNKSPFMIPTELYLRIKKKEGYEVVEGLVDDTVDPKLRWPIRNYNLVGILSGVSSPKAIIADKDGKTHIFKNSDPIANAGGQISQIKVGEVIVQERGVEVRLKLTRQK